MGIEANLERIATALETIAEVQSRMLTIAEWNKDRLSGPVVPAECGKPEEAAAPAPVQEAPAKTEPTYDELKAALIERGIEIPKGTKMTTLVKLWEKHQSDPVLPPEDPEEPKPEAVETGDIFGEEPAPVKEEKKPMTAEEARTILTANFSGTTEDKQLMLSALAKLGVTKFTEVPEGKFEELVDTFTKLKAGK